jgi:hypothetical protein
MSFRVLQRTRSVCRIALPSSPVSGGTDETHLVCELVCIVEKIFVSMWMSSACVNQYIVLARTGSLVDLDNSPPRVPEHAVRGVLKLPGALQDHDEQYHDDGERHVEHDALGSVALVKLLPQFGYLGAEALLRPLLLLF